MKGANTRMIDEEAHRVCTSDELMNHPQRAKRETIERRATREKLVATMH